MISMGTPCCSNGSVDGLSETPFYGPSFDLDLIKVPRRIPRFLCVIMSVTVVRNTGRSAISDDDVETMTGSEIQANAADPQYRMMTLNG